MKFADITSEDPRWTPRERLFLEHMFRELERYKTEKRKDNAYGIGKAIWIMGRLLEAIDPKKPTPKPPPQPQLVTRPMPEYKHTDFQDLL
jgi:hypothetical protein